MKLLFLTLAALAVSFASATTCDLCCCLPGLAPDATPEQIAEFWASCPADCNSEAECNEYDCPTEDEDSDAEARSGEITSYFMQTMAQSGASPQLLSMMANLNSGLSSKEMIKMQLMSQMGISTELVHLILNNGKFAEGDDANKNAMIKFLASSGAIPAALVPFLVKSDNAKEFYTFSMLESGAVNPLVGLLMLAKTNPSFDKETILELIMQSTMNGNPDDLLYGITTPYIPELPYGIFPGSQLSFAHFEGLGINTCSLHDLRNRFECGYTGISAADCEYAPYCCYSPVFMTDKQVEESTAGAITAASSIPWCYYNVFFVYHEQFYLEVAQVGGFAAPLQCPPFWKYGLQIDDSMAALVSGNAAFSKLTNERQECGFPGISEFQCVAIRGCCWDENVPYGQSQCFQAVDIPSFDPANIPTAYQPVDGMCDTNIYKIPMLYYQRKAVNYPLAFHTFGGYDIFQEPNRSDCLTKLGACYEDDESVVAQYPKIPRCYARSSTGTTNPVSPFASLFARSGESGISGYPKVEEPSTTGAPETTASD